ncbi:GNAT family N-acetyltransferase [Epibacterium sp. SM1979]|uniref:GNAT family N-acetyltransferase n=1 Tax=Tritonibacter litoralis TaxID=2662264 RepID=A0A843YMC3_9RHOB|nr:GNAT family N-acetyltransferase [Tritonibacter litoralis]MQQ10359.1 GNAT family N-acetyltransferase [Tritonibacter litoralis]
MTSADLSTPAWLYDLVEATWPTAALHQNGPVSLRDGQGGGSRVSAATVDDGFEPADLTKAIHAMRAMGQTPLFMVRDGQEVLDQALEQMGFVVKDPVIFQIAPTRALARETVPPVTTFDIWPPLAIQTDIWAEGGINAPRLAVMARVKGNKTAILGRVDDQPAATAFVAIKDGVAMLHALEVRTAHRRKGLARWMMCHAAKWAEHHGATQLAILVTRANTGANALYRSLGMKPCGQYHYRVLEPTA